MKKICLALALLSSVLFSSQTYVVDTEKSNVYFKAFADVLLFSDDEIYGVNQNVSGSVLVEGNDLVGGKIVVDVAGFNTQIQRRDNHIKEILNLQKNPQILFDIIKTTKDSEGIFLQGSLTINAITKEIKIPVKRKLVDKMIVYMGHYEIKYTDFELEIPTMGWFIKRARPSIEIGAKITFVNER